jgi:hypothetical protein
MSITDAASNNPIYKDSDLLYFKNEKQVFGFLYLAQVFKINTPHRIDQAIEVIKKNPSNFFDDDTSKNVSMKAIILLKMLKDWDYNTWSDYVYAAVLTHESAMMACNTILLSGTSLPMMMVRIETMMEEGTLSEGKYLYMMDILKEMHEAKSRVQ